MAARQVEIEGRTAAGDIEPVLIDGARRLVVVTAVAAPLVADVIDRAGRLVGIVYGENAQLQQLTPTDGVTPNESLESTGFLMVYDPVAGDWNRLREGSVIGSLVVEDTGVNTNPERWLHDNHWEDDEVTIAAAGVGGEQNLGGAVPAGETRRIRTLHVRHAGTVLTVLTILVSGGANKRSWDIQAQSTRVISSQDGWEFAAAEQPAVQSSDVTGGNTFVGAEGLEST